MTGEAPDYRDAFCSGECHGLCVLHERPYIDSDIRLEQIRTLTADVLTRESRVQTHYEGCYRYHAACLAHLVNNILEDE